jgi:endonuclease/exonuclease/phosphatase family metal-dependent hydrolase
MRKTLLNLLFVAFVICTGPLSAFAQENEANNKDRNLPVMTRNMDAGSDFAYVLTAALNPNTTQTELLAAITNTYFEMHLTNMAARADRLAAEIQASRPYLVGLQEVTTLRVGNYPGHATVVVDDQMQFLLAALEQRGLHYVPIKIQANADLELPGFDQSYNLITIGFTDYDVVLARTDLPVSQLKIDNIEAQHFNATLGFPVAGQTIPFVRGWIAIDAKLRGKPYRFVTTHLETFEPHYQAAQAEELLSGPLNTDMPVILAGDLNSDAHISTFANGPAFGILVSAGFADIWSELHPNDLGLTWPFYTEDPVGPATPFQRIDLILVRGSNIVCKSVALTGTTPSEGLWASDHAGVIASLTLEP